MSGVERDQHRHRSERSLATTVAACANLIGYDGTALWTTLVTPGAAAAEVRGRQRSCSPSVRR